MLSDKIFQKHPRAQIEALLDKSQENVIVRLANWPDDEEDYDVRPIELDQEGEPYFNYCGWVYYLSEFETNE